MIAERTSEFASKIEKGETVGFSFYYYNQEKNTFVSSLTKKILERSDKIFLHDTLTSVLKELIINAVKANSKRYFFKSNNLNITDKLQYSLGMNKFKSYIVSEKDKIEEKLKNDNLKVEVYFKKTADGTRIMIRNNTPILPYEMKRIQDRINSVKMSDDFAELYAANRDESEGEGLGLLLTLFFLKNSGMGENSLSIASNDKVTQSIVTIPPVLKPLQITNEIHRQILEQIEEIPSFPENIRALQDLCQLPDANIRDIIGRVTVDPGLTTAVLRLANSAGFISRKKIESVDDAVKIVGMKNLSAIVAASSAKALMDQKYVQYKEIWTHCNRVAFYAREIAAMTGRHKITDKIFLSAMLHDLGKIVLLASSDTLGRWINEIAENREMKSSTIIEEISIGISHSAIGEKISQKWNLPQYVTETIKNHHSPLMTHPEFYDVVFITYLANEMCNIEKGKYTYDHLENDVLKMFALGDKERFEEFHRKIRENFSEAASLNI